MIKKSGFSLLEMILSLVLISIVSVFIFRYIYVFYSNYDNSSKMYNQELDINKALILIHNIYSARVLDSQVVSTPTSTKSLKKGRVYDKANTALEFGMKDRQAFVGFYSGIYQDDHKSENQRFRGYISVGILDYNGTFIHQHFKAKEARFDLLNQKLGIDADINKDGVNDGFFIVLPFEKNVNDEKLKLGFGKKKIHDAYKVKCEINTSIRCYNPTYLAFSDEDNWDNFHKSKIISEKIRTNRRVFRYDILKEAIAFVLEEDKLMMYYNYTPWDRKGKKRTYDKGKKNIMIENVKTFRFVEEMTKDKKNATSFIRVEICIGNDLNTPVCKSIKIK